MNAYLTNITDNSLFTIRIKDANGDKHAFEDCVGFREAHGDFSVYELVDDVLIPRAIFYNPVFVTMEPKDVSKMREVARNRSNKAGR